MSSQVIMIMTTSPNLQEAEAIANELLKLRLVACVQILPGIESHYRWEGKMEKSSEILVQCKTLEQHQELVMETIQKLHSYQVPEILAIPVVGIHLPYLNWIKDSVLS